MLSPLREVREALRALGARALARPRRAGLAGPDVPRPRQLNTMTVEELDQRLQDGYRKNVY